MDVIYENKSKIIYIRRVLEIKEFIAKGNKKLEIRCLITKNEFQTRSNSIKIDHLNIENKDKIEMVIYEKGFGEWGKLRKFININEDINDNDFNEEKSNIVFRGKELYNYSELLKTEISHIDKSIGTFIPMGLKYEESTKDKEFYVLNSKDQKWYQLIPSVFEGIEIIEKSANKKIDGHLTKHIIYPNEYLKIQTKAYYNRDYLGYGMPNNPDFINTLKNTFDDGILNALISAKEEAVKVIHKDLQLIIEENNFHGCSVVCVPRAFVKEKYSSRQLYFLEAVKEAAKRINNTVDATDAIIRTISTKTTHLRKHDKIGDNYENFGSMPYPGITKDTCNINKLQIHNKKIILVDDIYTPNVNIDEDAIQALYDLKAKNIIFYSIAKTTYREKNKMEVYYEIF